MADAPRITIEDLQARMTAGEDFTVIDTRNPQAWADSDVKIPGAIRVPHDQLDEALPDVPKDKPIVAYCTWPNEGSSAGLAQELRKRGYKNVWALKGGFDAWRDADLPLERKREAA